MPLNRHQLHRLRIRHGLTLEQLATKAGLVDKSHASRLERGYITDPRLSALEGLAKALSVDISDLVTSRRQSPPPKPKKRRRPRGKAATKRKRKAK